MKTIYSILILFIAALTIGSCQEEDAIKNTGYLRLNVGTNSAASPQTRIIGEYNPKQIAVRILDSNNKVVDSTDDWETWEATQLTLKPGVYTIVASSNGFDGSESGFDIPYYAGSEQVTIENGKEKTANIVCTLANVKVTVNFDQTFINAFQSATATVASKQNNVGQLSFNMGTANRSAYFPVADLSATISVVNKAGKQFSQTNQLTNVQARDHYILNYKVSQSGSVGGVEVSVDDSQTTYTFNFNVSTEATPALTANAANAWSSFAHIEGKIAASDKELDPTFIWFEYKPASSENWITATATQVDDSFKATLTDLTPGTNYAYRLVYKKEAIEYLSNVVSFATEAATALSNGNLDDWYKSGQTWYAASNMTGLFWDSSNPGTTTGAGAIVNKNPTQGNSSVVHTPGGKSAELQSQYASAFGIGKFAAASLYAGKFNSLVGTNGAKIDFGRAFSSRPTQLHGWFQYSTDVMDYVGSNTPASLGIVKNVTPDLCSIYIALTTKTYQIDNTKVATFVDWENDPGVIAYGELPAGQCVSTEGAWKEFFIDLEYRNLTTKPSYIIIVFSASKYGDYFTGSTKSLMYLDDLELIYTNTPVL